MDSAIWAADRHSVDADNPWPGLLSFSEADEAFFHGRDSEAEALCRLIRRARLTVLFGLSGLGKSSLLQAGVFPRLRRDNVLPVYVRLNYASGTADLVGQVQAAIAEQAAAAGAEPPAARAGETLWETFHRRGADFWSPRNRPLLPLLAFDQFEEIFTLGRRHPGRDALIEALADLAEGRPPAALKARLDAHPEEAQGFAFGRHHYKLLLSLREDFLPDLESLRDRIAPLSLHRLRLRRMDGGAALAVVRQGGDLVAEAAAEGIVRFVAKARAPDAPLAELRVEPALLSVVCRELNNKRLERGDARITADLLAGSEEEILRGFYERAVDNIRPQVRAFVEEELLVEGFRDSVALEKALGAPGVDRQAIDQLVDRRLVRIDQRDGVERLELTHDLLTGVIAASRDRRRRREAAQRDSRAREAAELRERAARAKLRRSRLYSLVLAAAVLLSLAAVFFANQQRRALESSRRDLREAKGRADEAITALEESQALHAAELEGQKEVERELRALLEASAQERAEAERRLRQAEVAQRATNRQAEAARSAADEKLSAYSVAQEKLFAVVLVTFGESKITVIKAVRAVTSLGLKESKDLVESAPTLVKRGLSQAEASEIAKRLQGAGAKAQVQSEAEYARRQLTSRQRQLPQREP